MLNVHIDPTFLHTSPNATATSNIIAKCVPDTNMSYKCHIYTTYAIYLCTWAIVSICTLYQLKAINKVTRSTAIHIVHIMDMPLDIYACHIAYIWPITLLLSYIYSPNIATYTSFTKCNPRFTMHCHIYANSKCAHQMPNIWCIHKLVHFPRRRQLCPYICLVWNSFQTTGLWPWTNIPPKLHIYDQLHCCYSLHINPTLLHISGQKMKLLFTMLLPYICQQQICHSNATYTPHVQITWQDSMGTYTNTYAMCELTDTDLMTRSTGHSRTHDNDAITYNTAWLHELSWPVDNRQKTNQVCSWNCHENDDVRWKHTTEWYITFNNPNHNKRYTARTVCKVNPENTNKSRDNRQTRIREKAMNISEFQRSKCHKSWPQQLLTCLTVNHQMEQHLNLTFAQENA